MTGSGSSRRTRREPKQGALGLHTTGQATLATTGQASPVASTSATLNGTVSPGGLDTSYYFEYGTSATSLGSKTPKADAGSGSTYVPVSSALSGLKADTTYYFRSSPRTRLRRARVGLPR